MLVTLPGLWSLPAVCFPAVELEQQELDSDLWEYRELVTGLPLRESGF